MKLLTPTLRLLGALAFILSIQSCASQRNFIEVVYYGDSDDAAQQLAQKQAAKFPTASESNNVKTAQ